MYDGKKSVAEAHRLRRFRPASRSKIEAGPAQRVPAAHLTTSLPAIEVRSRRVGGATYQVPVEVRTERRQALAIRWIIYAARDRNEHDA